MLIYNLIHRDTNEWDVSQLRQLFQFNPARRIIHTIDIDLKMLIYNLILRDTNEWDVSVSFVTYFIFLG
ncbi:hypothetical protein YC2023_071227 [Brassica napus]